MTYCRHPRQFEAGKCRKAKKTKEKKEMAKCGAETEVYSRVCGYHRPVRNWNKGKREEFKDRKTFKADYSSEKVKEAVA